MPRKAQYSKEDIVAAALGVAAKKGMDGLTAKELGAALGTSTSPIFTVFDSMHQVQVEVRRAAMAQFESYADKVKHITPAFKQAGMQMIRFALEEPNLYRLCFMTGGGQITHFREIYDLLGESAPKCIALIRHDYGLTEQEAEALFEHVWIYTYGIGALCATGMCQFSEEEISDMLTKDFTGMMMFIRTQQEKEGK